MKLTKDLKSILFNNFSLIKDIAIIYPNDVKVSGFGKEVKGFPFEVTICKHSVIKGENPYHLIDFVHVVEISITLHDGTNKTFS